MRDIRVIDRSAPKRSAGARKSPLAQAALAPGTSGTLSAPAGTQAASAPEVTAPVSSSEHLGTTTYTPHAGSGSTRHAPAHKTESDASHSFDSSD
jgi:hypothetical protein